VSVVVDGIWSCWEQPLLGLLHRGSRGDGLTRRLCWCFPKTRAFCQFDDRTFGDSAPQEVKAGSQGTALEA